MTRLSPLWSATDTSPNTGEWFPVCPKCEEPYSDGQILEVKNYPDDGGALLFLECESCKTEAQLDFSWSQLQPKTFTVVKRKKEND